MKIHIGWGTWATYGSNPHMKRVRFRIVGKHPTSSRGRTQIMIKLQYSRNDKNFNEYAWIFVGVDPLGIHG